jgi:hypothetical protein
MIKKRLISSKKILPIICFGLILLCSCQNRTSKTSEISGQKGHVVVAYYFHRTIRCATCLEIEANTELVIGINFPQYIAEGILIWKPFNLDDDGGKELKKQFDISTNTLVLAEISKGHIVKYKKLEEVWQLIGNPERFSKYVTNELNNFMNDI